MGGELASFMSSSTSASLLVGMYSLSALSKFVSEEHRKLFPTLPGWFWSAAGAWELAMTALFLHGDYTLAIPMSYTYLGGALSAGLLLSPSGHKIPLTLLPTAFILITSSLAAHSNINLYPQMPIFCVSGFAIGTVFAYSGGSSNKSD